MCGGDAHEGTIDSRYLSCLGETYLAIPVGIKSLHQIRLEGRIPDRDVAAPGGVRHAGIDIGDRAENGALGGNLTGFLVNTRFRKSFQRHREAAGEGCREEYQEVRPTDLEAFAGRGFQGDLVLAVNDFRDRVSVIVEAYVRHSCD